MNWKYDADVAAYLEENKEGAESDWMVVEALIESLMLDYIVVFNETAAL